MDALSKQTNPSEPQVGLSAVPASPLPTPQALDTPPKSPAQLTDDGRPTVAVTPDSATPPPASRVLLPGTVIDGYVIVRAIDSTQMSMVFQARQPGTDQLVAMKFIQRDGTVDSPSIERFHQEIKTLGRLQPHKNIVPIYHVGRFQSELYYVMPFLPAGSLSRHMGRIEADRRKAVALVEKIARAVHLLHTQQPKILHRDIKPGNILLGEDDEPMLADFGLVKLLGDGDALTQTQNRPGTPPYMAPEQTGLVFSDVCEGTDIWALGVVLYELLTGKRPFPRGKEEDLARFFRRIAYDTPPGPRTVRPDMDAALEAVVLKCLEKRPEDRFGSAEELADELGRWLRAETLQTPRRSRARRLWRGVRMVAGMAALGLLFAASAVAYRHATDPQRGLESLASEYARERRVALAAEKEPLVWNEWLSSKPGTLARSTDGYHQLSTEDFAALILARDLPAATFRLRAKIRHDVAASLDCEVGMFVACRPLADDKPAHLMYACTFNDVSDAKELERQGFVRPKTIRGNNFQLKYKAIVPAGNDFDTWEPMWVKLAHFEPAGHVGGRWRDVVLEVHADRLLAKLDDKSTAPMFLQQAETRLAAELPEFFAKHQMPVPRIATMFDPRGSMGIFVTRGIASFKEIVVEELSSQ